MNTIQPHFKNVIFKTVSICMSFRTMVEHKRIAFNGEINVALSSSMGQHLINERPLLT